MKGAWIFILIVLTIVLIPILPPVGTIALTCMSLYLIYQGYVLLYFRSNKFKQVKDSIKAHTQNCNELNYHIQELKCTYVNIKSNDYGNGNLYDDSKFNFTRREWSKEIKNKFVHNCSLSVCKNASDQPFKYLCKYFNITADETTLTAFEKTLNDFAAAEQGKILLIRERDQILNNTRNSIPSMIYAWSKTKLIKHLGFQAVDLSDLYVPVYTFQYVSAGGNSSSKCDIKLDVQNLDKFIAYLDQKLTFRKSIAGQRALMTSGLRETIKAKDNYSCRKCYLSAHEVKNLLLEIDHIIPLSKGGTTSVDNLQTLCWRCNRAKGSKIEYFS